MRSHIDSLGNKDAARRFAKHDGKMHDASYSNRTWCPKLMLAKVAGHRDGWVQLYRATIWCSTEQDPAFKGLFDRITLVTDAQLADAKMIMEGRSDWAGVRATLIALRNYTDVILQTWRDGASIPQWALTTWRPQPGSPSWTSRIGSTLIGAALTGRWGATERKPTG